MKNFKERKLKEFDKKYDEWEAIIMFEVYELIKINFNSEIIADATQIIPVKKEIETFILKALSNQKKEIIEMIKKHKEATHKRYGTFKYDSTYNEVIDIIKKI